MSPDLELALELADTADAITVGRYRAADLRIETKPDLTPVTEADRDVEAAARARLAEDRPQDGIVGEEFGPSPETTDRRGEDVGPSLEAMEMRGEGFGPSPGAGGSRQGFDSSPGVGARRRWVIDPIDGTMNYVRGIPVWATLIALQDDDAITVGVVSAPALGRRWWAARGEGAWVTDSLSPRPRPIHVSTVTRLEDAQLAYAGIEDWRQTLGLEPLLRLAAACWRTRGLGDFWTYMLLAEGAVDVVCEPDVSVWDLAAPRAIVEEAGGVFTDLGGVATAAGGDALATNGHLHEAVRALVGR